MRPETKLRLGPGEAWALLAAVGYALMNVFARMASMRVPLLVAVIYYALVTAAVAWWLALRSEAGRQGLRRLLGERELLLPLLGAALVSFVVGNVSFFWSLRVGGVVVAAPLTATTSLWAALLAWLLMAEPLNRSMVGGMALALAGVAMLAWGQQARPQLEPQALWAVPAALLAACTWALAVVAIRYLTSRGVSHQSLMAVYVSAGLGGVLAVLLATGQGERLAQVEVVGAAQLLVAGGCNALALLSLAAAISRTEVAGVMILSSLNVPLAATLGVVLLGEPMNALLALGMAVVLLGVIWVQRSRPSAGALAGAPAAGPEAGVRG